uniref:Uncharacterized protein n=1 Tax=Compsopogon caeruleus TaxID=31354 RepID=A0A7S1XEK1_9RHOD
MEGRSGWDFVEADCTTVAGDFGISPAECDSWVVSCGVDGGGWACGGELCRGKVESRRAENRENWESSDSSHGDPGSFGVGWVVDVERVGHTDGPGTVGSEGSVGGGGQITVARIGRSNDQDFCSGIQHSFPLSVR